MLTNRIHQVAKRSRFDLRPKVHDASSRRSLPNERRWRPDHDALRREALRHVHFIAIGGTGMGSLAGLVKARGIEVTGSDKKLYPPMSTALADWGIDVSEGFSPRARARAHDPIWS